MPEAQGFHLAGGEAADSTGTLAPLGLAEGTGKEAVSSPIVGTAQAGSESLIWGRSWPGTRCLQIKGHCLT